MISPTEASVEKMQKCAPHLCDMQKHYALYTLFNFIIFIYTHILTENCFPPAELAISFGLNFIFYRFFQLISDKIQMKFSLWCSSTTEYFIYPSSHQYDIQSFVIS